VNCGSDPCSSHVFFVAYIVKTQLGHSLKAKEVGASRTRASDGLNKVRWRHWSQGLGSPPSYTDVSEARSFLKVQPRKEREAHYKLHMFSQNPVFRFEELL
jgi:hypothetical protein